MDEIIQACNECNFGKGVGDDGFDGRILERNIDLRRKILMQLRDSMNLDTLPTYLTKGRLVPLSKRKCHEVVKLDEIRPIVVRSHLCKIVEKTILNRLKTNHAHLISSGRYQTGFK